MQKNLKLHILPSIKKAIKRIGHILNPLVENIKDVYITPHGVVVFLKKENQVMTDQNNNAINAKKNK